MIYLVFFKLRKKIKRNRKYPWEVSAKFQSFGVGRQEVPPSFAEFRHPPKRFGLRLTKSRQNGDVPKHFGWSFGVPGTLETPKRVPDPPGHVPM